MIPPYVGFEREQDFTDEPRFIYSGIDDEQCGLRKVQVLTTTA